jgi:hypothetical protein
MTLDRREIARGRAAMISSPAKRGRENTVTIPLMDPTEDGSARYYRQTWQRKVLEVPVPAGLVRNTQHDKQHMNKMCAVILFLHDELALYADHFEYREDPRASAKALSKDGPFYTPVGKLLISYWACSH